MSGLAPQAAQLAGRVGDGYRLAMPDGDLVRAFGAAGARHKPVQAGMEVTGTPTATSPRRLRTALWATCAPRSATSAKRALPGRLAPTAAKRLR